MCPAGIEPATFWFPGQSSNQLIHIGQDRASYPFVARHLLFMFAFILFHIIELYPKKVSEHPYPSPRGGLRL